MSFKRKDLEIAYNLRWKNGPKREDKEMSIISVYDIPATTLNFEVFKSYLLKNSGTAEHDVRVSYIMDNGKEYPIQSQTDFQVALYAFRRKARSGEFINLLLEKISDQPIHKNLRHSNDVETQIDNMEPSSMASTCCNAELPPVWFISYMAQLKKDITEDITATISSVVSSALVNVKPQVVSQPPCHHHHSRKGKPEKRIRKITPHLTEGFTDAKDLKKSLKLEHKLDKLEFKAAKYREKRLALQNAPKSSDSEAGHSSSRSRSRDKGEKQEEAEPKMDAKPINCQSVVPHMLGGEIYMHQWDVENIGEAPWTSKTHLQYTWGSKSFKPVNKIISVPYLKPGARGTISVRLQVPNESGQYECYWQFMHKDRRFGSWLGCQIIVDPFDLKGNRSVLETGRFAFENHFSGELESEEAFRERAEDVALLQNFLRGSDSELAEKSAESARTAEEMAARFKTLQGHTVADHSESVKNITEQLVREVTDNIERINLHENLDSDSNCSFYDNESLFDGSSSSKTSFKDEFVLVPVPNCFVLDGQEQIVQKIEQPNEIAGKDSPKKAEDEVKAVVHKGSLEQAEFSGGTLSKKTSEKVLNTSGNNFDDNNNTESGATSAANSIKLRDEDLDNIVVITVPKDDQIKEGFIYVHVDGQKVLIPKNILKSEVVNAAQELEKAPGSRSSIGVIVDSNEAINQTPTPSLASTITRQASHHSGINEDENAGNTTDSVPVLVLRPEQKQDNIAIDMTMTSMKDNDDYIVGTDPVNSNYFEANNYMSHCSAAGSCFSEVNSQSERNNRLFIFPQNVPGYEVVHPVETNNDLYPNLANEAFVPPTSSAPFNIPPPANPFAEHVPNFQQTPAEQRAAPVPPTDTPSAYQGQDVPFNHFEGVPIGRPANHGDAEGVRAGAHQETPDATPQVNILPEMLVSGAVNAASTAFSTARSVINNMIRPQSPGRWVNGHWVSSSPQTPREANLQALAEMGFWNRDLNATLLARFNDDLNRVVAELVQ